MLRLTSHTTTTLRYTDGGAQGSISDDIRFEAFMLEAVQLSVGITLPDSFVIMGFVDGHYKLEVANGAVTNQSWLNCRAALADKYKQHR